ncbi:MAG: class I SAM-dependent methyltransferase [Candidatus Omnitrophica bacterium]|nr:class I SAM-dependent methyltransferase [Candidatus Omnitrophota bacterium]
MSNITKNYICPICGSHSGILGYKNGVHAVKCPVCTFTWKDMQDLPKDYYDTWQYGSAFSFGQRNKKNVFKFRLDLIAKVCDGQINKIMDFGCGKGEFVKFLRNDKNYEAYGCDIGPDTPDKTYFFKSDISDLPLSELDLITSFETFEHIENISAVLDALASRLRKNGYMYIETQYTHINHILSWEYFDKAHHVSFYNPKSMKTLMEKHGMELIYYDNKPWPLNLRILKRKVLHFSYRFIPPSVQKSAIYKKLYSLARKIIKKITFTKPKNPRDRDWLEDILMKHNCTFIARKS